MSALGLLGSYGSDSSDDSDADGSDNSDSEPKDPKQKGITSLPSADDMFNDTVAPSFLDHKVEDEPVIVPVKTKMETKSVELKQKQPIDGRQQAAAVEKKRARDEDAEIQRLKTSLAATEANKKKAKLGTNAKDRVKGQRLKGQAGIGSDFKTWKSDAEMVMRQQFD
jgi:hypothetical protein